MSNELEVTTQESGLPVGFGDQNVSLAVSLARAEVDQQVATARALPRSITQVVRNITTLATLDEDSAAECVYALPRGGKPIKGPSIRLAEIISSQWGNARVGARVVHVDRVEKFVEAEGVFHDLETNMATTARVRRRISDKNGKLLTDDMIIVTGNAACAIAKRNAILGGVPKAVWRKAYGSVEQVIAGDVVTLVERREKAMKAFAAFGVKPEQVFDALGVAGIDDVTLEHMPTLVGMHSSLKNGEATVEEMFAKRQAVTGEASGLKDRLTAPKDRAGFNVEHINRETGEVTNTPSKAQPTEEEKPTVGRNTEIAASPAATETAAGQSPGSRAAVSTNSETEKPALVRGFSQNGEEQVPPSSPPFALKLGRDGEILQDSDDQILAQAMKKVEQGLKPLMFWFGGLDAPSATLLDPLMGELKRLAAHNDPKPQEQKRPDYWQIGKDAALASKSRRDIPDGLDRQAQDEWYLGFEAGEQKLAEEA